MKMNFASLLFITSLMTGTFIAVSSSSWFGIWMGLELNLLSFVPLMAHSSKFSAEASLKYFLTQAFASVLILLGIMFDSMNNMWIDFDAGVPSQVILLAALMKMGAAPTHFWFPEVSNGLSWNSNMILMTWQKIAPFVILMYLNIPSLLLTLTVSLSATVGALGGFNQVSLRKILAFSSINHMAWMLMSISASQIMWITYFVIYSLMTLTMMGYFNNNNYNSLSQLSSFSLSSPLEASLVSLNMLSMGGLPPFLGFLPKWMIMEYMINSSMYFTALYMIFMTLIVLYFYLRLTYSSFMFYVSSLKYNIKNYPPSNIVYAWLSIMGLMAGPLLILL